MITIQLPALGTSEDQLKYVVRIVQEHVPDTYKKGMQVILNKDVIENTELQEKVYRNIQEFVPEDFVLIFHAPISPHEDDPRLNLLNEECVGVYTEIATLAERCNAHSMIIHSNCVFPEAHENVQDLFPKVVQNFHNITSNIPIMVENLPFPLNGDTETDPTKIPFDPFLGTIEQVEEFLEKTNAPFCFDTSHFGILRKNVQEPQPSLLEFWNRVHEKTLCIQLADFKGQWKAHQATFEEGSPIGEGELADEFAPLLQKAAIDNPNLILSVDVEVKDFLHRPEQIEGIKRVIGYLDSTNFKKQTLSE